MRFFVQQTNRCCCKKLVKHFDCDELDSACDKFLCWTTNSYVDKPMQSENRAIISTYITWINGFAKLSKLMVNDYDNAHAMILISNNNKDMKAKDKNIIKQEKQSSLNWKHDLTHLKKHESQVNVPAVQLRLMKEYKRISQLRSK